MNNEQRVQWKYKLGQSVVFRPLTHLHPDAGFTENGVITSVYTDNGLPAYTIMTDREYYNAVKEEDMRGV